MLADLDQHGGSDPIEADLCIIGSGAAGIAIAREFVDSPYRVIVLEGGGETFEEASQDAYRSEVVGLPHRGVHDGRVRVLGGTTTLWAGQVLPLFDIDFRKRDWVPESGWPIGLDDLAPFYRRAEEVLQVPHRSYDAATWPRPNPGPPAYNVDLFRAIYSQFCREPSFAVKYREELSSAPRVTVMTHATVTSLEATADARAVTGGRVRSLAGTSNTVHARAFVICAGGIDSARLLLLSDSVEATGIGNRHDVVGRYFQDHPGVAVPVIPRDRRLFSRLYDSFFRDGRRHAVRIGASPILQERDALLHVGAEVYYPTDGGDPLASARDLARAIKNREPAGELIALAGTVARRPVPVARAAFRRYVLGRPPSVGSGRPHLGLGGEQDPDPNSRVTLSHERDGFGMRRVKLDWRVSPATTRSFERFATTLNDEWRRMGLAELDLEAVQFEGRDRGLHGGYVDASHHMGTTRMGTDPRTSVVDADCRVHGYDNLFVGSSSVFPTGGASNPTFTMLALCVRIADRLKADLARLPVR